MVERQRVAVLGGGIAGLSTALELTSTQELRDRYDVIVHQLGWRAGGKCATGRDGEHGERILEHGLHLWFSAYVNAFRLLKDCYEELDRPADHPLRNINEAWSPLPGSVLYEQYDDRWVPQQLTYPVTPGLPWDDVPVPHIWDLIVAAVDLALKHPIQQLSSPDVGPIATLIRRAGNAVENRLGGVVRRYAGWRRKHTGGERRHLHPIARLLAVVRWHQWRRARNHLDDAKVRHHIAMIDLSITSIIGYVRDEIAFRGFGSIDDQDLRAWLTLHGANDLTLDSPMVRVLYDQIFAASLGPPTTDSEPWKGERPGVESTAAGAALFGVFGTSLPGPGSVMWQATAGMGDTAIAPMYETLVKRGVRFEFFHSVTHLGVDRERDVVDKISIVRQARPIGGTYDPLRDVTVGADGTGRKGTLRCWPSEPMWDRLENGAQLREAHLDFEVGDAEPDAEHIELRLGEDFDTVVLAISAAALPPICGEVMEASPAFDEMLRNTYTTMTQAFQIWLNTPLTDVGFPYPHAATSTYREPIDTGADNTQVAWTEHWPAGNDQKSTTNSVWYFCGGMDDEPGDDPDTTLARARAGAIDQLRHIGGQWPGAVEDGDFRWDLLAAPDGTEGIDRFDQQFWRANSTPTERYVLTPPGSVKYRLGADESGLGNLILAGDWTKNTFNFGAVEATVMTGMAAARAISGHPAVIKMEWHNWLPG